MVYDKPLEDWEYPEPDDADDEEATSTITCPVCRRQIYEDASQCPYCGTNVDEMLPTIFKGRPIWFILLAVFGLLALLILELVIRPAKDWAAKDRSEESDPPDQETPGAATPPVETV